MKKWIKMLAAALLLLGCLPGAALASQEEEGPEPVRLPIVMYHSILSDPGAQGKYVVSPSLLESDFKYLKSNGYESVTLDQLVDYVDGGAELPEQPILITFDDGFLNSRTYALPLLEAYDLHAVISVIGVHTETFSSRADPNPSYAHLTWDDIALLAASGRVEIGNHTYNMHCMSPRRGCTRRRGESLEAYKEAFVEDVTTLQSALMARCGLAPVVFTYPFGLVSEDADPLIRDLGFRLSLSCRERVNEITRNPDCLFLLGRFNRPAKVSTAQFMQRLKPEKR